MNESDSAVVSNAIKASRKDTFIVVIVVVAEMTEIFSSPRLSQKGSKR